MARYYYSFSLQCPDCDANGTANGSDNKNRPNFDVDSVTDGFEQATCSPNPFARNFRCACGGQAAVEIS